MSRSKDPASLGKPCARCGRDLVPPFARITKDGRVICKCWIAEERRRWLARHQPERLR